MKKKIEKPIVRKVTTKHVVVSANSEQPKPKKSMSSSHMLWSSASDPRTTSDISIYANVPLHRSNNQQNLRTYFGMQWFRQLADLFPFKSTGNSSPALATEANDDAVDDRNEKMCRASMNLPVEVQDTKKSRKTVKQKRCTKEGDREEVAEPQQCHSRGGNNDEAEDSDVEADRTTQPQTGGGSSVGLNSNSHCNASVSDSNISVSTKLKSLYRKIMKKCLGRKKKVSFQMDAGGEDTDDEDSCSESEDADDEEDDDEDNEGSTSNSSSDCESDEDDVDDDARAKHSKSKKRSSGGGNDDSDDESPPRKVSRPCNNRLEEIINSWCGNNS